MSTSASNLKETSFTVCDKGCAFLSKRFDGLLGEQYWLIRRSLLTDIAMLLGYEYL